MFCCRHFYCVRIESHFKHRSIEFLTTQTDQSKPDILIDYVLNCVKDCETQVLRRYLRITCLTNSMFTSGTQINVHKLYGWLENFTVKTEGSSKTGRGRTTGQLRPQFSFRSID